MKSFIAIALIAVFAATAFAASPAATKAEDAEVQNAAQGTAAAPADLTRLRKSAYGGSSGSSYGGGHASIPAPPCAKNYLFSCQPNLAPVPCSSPSAGGYGSQGAYSIPVPSYAVPLRGNYGYQQAYARSFLPQALNYNQFYQY